MTTIDVVVVGLVSVLAGVAALVIVAWLPLPARALAPVPSRWPFSWPFRRAPATEALDFAFEGGSLVQACAAGHRLIDCAPPAADDLGRLTTLLSPQMPDLAGRIATLQPDAGATLRAEAPLAMCLTLQRNGRRLHLQVAPAPGRSLAALVAELMAEAMERLRALVEAAPFPVWQEDDAQRIVWANPAYLALAAGSEARDLATAPLFPPATGTGRATRQRVVRSATEGEVPRWHDCLRRPLPGAGQAGFALPADDLVRAETTLRGFLHTLSRTFAHLPIGLAIFDAEGRLNLFNPVLSDLTGLPPDFLARRPTLHAVLDRLRELRMIPEPRDYAAWRRRIADIERAADAGHYTELWPLPSGQTFRVTGQPDADGGVALLFENVTSETARNRALKRRGDLMEAALSALDGAIAVFDGPGGSLVQTEAYLRLWGVAAMQDAGLAAALDRWAAGCRPTPLWQELRGAAEDPAGYRPRHETLAMTDGRILAARFLPLPGRGLLAEFVPQAAAPRAGRRSGPAAAAPAGAAPHPNPNPNPNPPKGRR